MNGKLLKYNFSGEKGTRLDKFLTSQIEDISRSQIQHLIDEGLAEVNGKIAKKSGLGLEPGDLITFYVPPPAPVDLIPEEIPLDILFENKDMLVINKPAGMVVHPSAGHTSGTLVHAVLAHVPDLEGIGGVHRPGIVHRLDKDTSGIILVAKNDRAHRFLQDQFRNRSVKKIYRALLDSHPPTPEGRIEAPIGRDSRNRKRMAVVQENKGRTAVTEYYTLQDFSHHSYVEAHPLTGRTHQIRIHMAYLKAPVVGDTLYGYKKPSLDLGRHFLHAFSLEIHIPGRVLPIQFTAELPEDLLFWLNKLS